jgi:putative membrane protein insertion efficiency factor
MLIKILSLKLLNKYQKNVSPYLKKNGYRCVYKITCSQYAVNSLTDHNEFKALLLIIARLLSCNPINAFIYSKKGNLI